jgi:hypothetical protein
VRAPQARPTTNEGRYLVNDMQLYGNGGLASRPARQAGRAISRNQMGASVRVSAVDAETDVTVAKIGNVTMATGSAARAVVQVAQLQQALEQLIPGASGRRPSWPTSTRSAWGNCSRTCAATSVGRKP